MKTVSNTHSVRSLTQIGLIAGLYAALCLFLAPASFGAVQVRAAEMLTVLPVYMPQAVPGLTLGCFVANLLSGGVAGPIDWLVGTAATLISALLTRRWRHCRFRQLPVLSTLPPVLINAVAVGGELALTSADGFSFGVFGLTALQVGLGQLIACVGGGLVLAHAFNTNAALQRLTAQ